MLQPSTPPIQRTDGIAQGVAHYENFPVASWLCPARLRAPIAAIYWFARTADDIADEGDAPADNRLALLRRYRDDLIACADGNPVNPVSQHWPHVFGPLARAIHTHDLPVNLLLDLLSAFEQDIRFTASGERYVDDAQLLDYCARSANPVGRLLLHLYGVTAPEALAHSDAVCSALQLINFWQDLSRDIPNRRIYLPLADCEPLNLTFERMQALATGAQPRSDELKIIARKSMNSETKMQFGSKIVHQVPGRAGWELRGVVQGGLAILRGMERINFNTWHHRPTVGKRHVPGLVWRALWM